MEEKCTRKYTCPSSVVLIGGNSDGGDIVGKWESAGRQMCLKNII